MGKITAESFMGINLEQITKVLLQKKYKDSAKYQPFFYNPRTFVHQIAHILGVGVNFRQIVR